MRKYFLFAVVNLIFTISLCAQVNTDSIFQVAIDKSKIKDYKGALENASKLLSIYPGRYDVSVFIANVYAWKGDFDSAKKYINISYKINPEYNRLYDSWLNILLWNGEYDELLRVISLAKNNGYNNHYNMLLKNMLAYKNMREYQKAINAYKEYNKGGISDSTTVKSLYRELQFLNKHNTISVFYSVDFFDKDGQDPQHLAFVDYAFKINKHRLLLRVNYANRFNTDGVQMEADFYQLFNQKRYLYYNYGYSFDNDIFPQHRMGAEYYFPLNNYEGSVGVRYLKFKDAKALIATTHLAKYFSNYWLALRPFYVINDSGNAFASVVNIRRYSGYPKSYWGIELNYGNSPDERFILNSSMYKSRQDSYRIKLEKNIAFGNARQIKISAGYGYEEYVSNSYRNRYIIEVICKF